MRVDNIVTTRLNRNIRSISIIKQAIPCFGRGRSGTTSPPPHHHLTRPKSRR
ncbi:hypothetical protein HanRHA438_Chr09g0408291 [Helianthus annuus]|nr:hypothetical protein HanRHA438_Chr09g0408291 [Helianthus annuus]